MHHGIFVVFLLLRSGDDVVGIELRSKSSMANCKLRASHSCSVLHGRGPRPSNSYACIHVPGSYFALGLEYEFESRPAENVVASE